MESQKTIEIHGYTIRLTLDDDNTRLKPVLCDLCEATGLKHLIDPDQTKRLLNLLISGKYKEALKSTSYGSDLNMSEAKLRLIRFLTIGMGCLLILDDNRSNNKIVFNQHREFIAGIFGFPFSNHQILNLIMAEFPDYVLNINLE